MPASTDRLPAVTVTATARSILTYLGGTTFLRKTGARFLNYHSDHLAFQIPPTKVNTGMITDVLITVVTGAQFNVVMSNRRAGVTVVSASNVAGTNLATTFTALTGLKTA